MHSLRTVFVVVATLLATSPAALGAQPIIAVPNAHLTQQQNKTLAEIRKLPTTQSAHVVWINTSSLDAHSRFEVPIGNNQSVQIQGMDRIGGDQESFQWQGRVLDQSDEIATLIVNGPNVTGTIRTHDGVLRIRPLGGGLHALVRVNLDNFPREDPRASEKDKIESGPSPDK